MKSKVVFDLSGVVGPAARTVEEQNTEVVAAQVNAGLQTSRAAADDDAVEEFSAVYFTCFFDRPSLSVSLSCSFFGAL